jgi:hypothetical protein
VHGPVLCILAFGTRQDQCARFGFVCTVFSYNRAEDSAHLYKNIVLHNVRISSKKCTHEAARAVPVPDTVSLGSSVRALSDAMSTNTR